MANNTVWVPAFCLAFSACNASLQGDAAAKVEIANAPADEVEGAASRRFGAADAQVVTDGELSPTNRDAYTSAPGTALIGARHDLKLAEGGKRTACACVSAALGQAADPAFQWSGERANTDPNVQLTLALSGEAVACKGEPAGSLGPSYWGFRWEGADLVVLLESATVGKPVTSGAVLPRPKAGGQVYLAPVDPNLPYGKALNGGGDRCLLGNPGGKAR
ncbi:MAG: hypothetical protein SFV15_15780 [Polyangiaceae bacterium]|nr:hypothetical protein [Polyangiaceae bacterium]